MKQSRLAPSVVQTTKNVLTDLNRIIANTEAWTSYFVRYSIVKKEPFPRSCLVYNYEKKWLQFWKPSKVQLRTSQLPLKDYKYQEGCAIREDKFIYYPPGLPYIVVVYDIDWIRDIHLFCKMNPGHVDEQVALYGRKLYDYINGQARVERELMKTILSTYEKRNKYKGGKTLF